MCRWRRCAAKRVLAFAGIGRSLEVFQDAAAQRSKLSGSAPSPITSLLRRPKSKPLIAEANPTR